MTTPSSSKPSRVRRLYIADYCLTPSKRIDHCAILCQDGHILAIGGVSAFSRSNELEVYEFTDSYATPGFIDTHIHGAGGFDSSSVVRCTVGIDAMSRTLAGRGVTSFVPTVVSSPVDEMLANLTELARMMDAPVSGAEPVGIHIEGPFINNVKRGAQLATAICDVDLGYARELIAAGLGKIKRMTFAPELKNAEKLIELLCESNVLPSMGHSIAGDTETLRAIDAGARCCTHLFNGMPPLEQRHVTLTSIALTDDRVTTEIILDGRHIHPRMVDLACRCKPGSKLVAISDATMASGMPDGAYWLGDSEILVENGYSHTGAGTLAGTTTLLDTGWHSLMNYGRTDETYAAGSVSYNAALSLGLDDRGVLRPGKRADLAIFEQESNRLLMTVRSGEIVYRAPDVRAVQAPEVQA